MPPLPANWKLRSVVMDGVWVAEKIVGPEPVYWSVPPLNTRPVVALPKPAAVPTVNGATFSVGADLGITDGRGRTAMLVATDVIASNGVIHVIDKVLLPPL